MVRSRRRPVEAPARRALAQDDAAAVFARAAEIEAERSLAATERDDDGLDEDELLEVAAGAGLSPVAVRQALAELRTGAIGSGVPGLAPLDGREASWVGARCVVAQRIVPLAPVRARAAAERFLRSQLFELERDRGERSSWRPKRGFAASAQRTVDSLFKKLELDGVADPVALAVVEEPGSDGERSLVRIEADLAPVRGSMAWGVGGGAATAGVVGGGILAAVTGEPTLLLASLPLGGATAGTGVAIARRSYADQRDRAATCLEAFLDRLEHGRA